MQKNILYVLVILIILSPLMALPLIISIISGCLLFWMKEYLKILINIFLLYFFLIGGAILTAAINCLGAIVFAPLMKIYFKLGKKI